MYARARCGGVSEIGLGGVKAGLEFALKVVENGSRRSKHRGRLYAPGSGENRARVNFLAIDRLGVSILR